MSSKNVSMQGELTWFLLSFNRVNMAICNDEVLQSLLLSTLDLKRITTCKTTNSLIKLVFFVCFKSCTSACKRKKKHYTGLPKNLKYRKTWNFKQFRQK